MVLKGIPPILSPDLLQVLASMGHGDMLVFGDSNFPSSSVSAEGARLVRADGHAIADLLEAVLQFFPLDTQDPAPVGLLWLEAVLTHYAPGQADGCHR